MAFHKFYPMKKIVLFLLLFTLFETGFGQQDYFYVQTKDSLRFLNYGNGTDRLGGAKMTFLDSNILLKVVDSFRSQYKVQLSALHHGWIEKDQVKEPENKTTFQFLTGSWKVYGDTIFDYVSISMPERLPYRSRMDMNPSRIVVDLFGVTSNTNWINQLSTAKEIKKVWYNQIEDDMMQVFIELNHQAHWGYKIYYDSLRTLNIRVKRQPPVLTIENLKIAVDAGHGGDQPGTRGIKTKILEKNYTLLYAKELEKELTKRGAIVVMTREKDTSLSMYERIKFLEEENPDLLISVHFNSSSKDTIQGVSTYYRYIAFRPLSTYILSQMVTTGLKEFGNIGSFNFSLNGPTQYPNCLVEVAFLSNADDERKIRDPQFRILTATKIADGIEDFLANIPD